MKLTNLWEAPLQSYEVLRGKSDREVFNKRVFTKRRLDKFVELKGAVTKRLEGVGVDIHFYVMSHRARDGANIQYQEINAEDLVYAYGEQLAAKIKHDPKSITIIVDKHVPSGTGDDRAHFSWWGIIHDMIHGMTLSVHSIGRVFNRSSDVPTLRNMVKRWSGAAGEHDIANANNTDIFLQTLCTFKSAREQHGRDEEVTTEVMTQYLTNPKGIVFQIPSYVPTADRKEFAASLKILKREMEAVFDQVLIMSKGRIVRTIS